MSADTAQRVIAVIAKFKKIPEDQITTETSLKDLELDSLDGLNLVFELEEEFDIFIPDDKALTLQNVGEMVTGIDMLLAEKANGENAAEDAKTSAKEPASEPAATAAETESVKETATEKPVSETDLTKEAESKTTAAKTATAKKSQSKKTEKKL